MSELLRSRKLCTFFLQVWLCAVSTFSSAGDYEVASSIQSAGLMWNRSGLPAVFPLQVKTPAGQDYFLTLIDVESGEDALAAYIIGGDFFKVLVPPGEFRLRFAAGANWQGEERLFGPGAKTLIFELDETLIFEIRRLTIKAGHVVNIEEVEPGQTVQSSVKEQLICQSLRRTYPSRAHHYWGKESAPDTGNKHWIRSRNGSSKYLGDRILNKDLYPPPYEHYDSEPEYSLISRYCG